MLFSTTGLSVLSVACHFGAALARLEAHKSLSYDFTLAALSTTRPNDNSTGVPLVIGQDGAEEGIQFHVTSTFWTFPYNLFPRLVLQDNVLRAYGRGSDRLETNATALENDDALRWNTTTVFNKKGSAVYSATPVSASNEFPLLAAYGSHDLWSLCTFNGAPGQPDMKLNNVVFNISVGTPSSLFNASSCYPIVLNIVKA